MKKSTLIFLGFMTIMIFGAGCYGPGTVTVGVGVGVGGPWVGSYGHPGGTVWVGRPVGPVYYHLDPVDETGTEWVEAGRNYNLPE